MEDKNIFIDSFVKRKIQNYKENPNTSWENLQHRMEQKNVLSYSHNGFRTGIAIISGVVVITAGIYFLQTENNSETIQKQDVKQEIINTKSKKDKNDVIIINKEKVHTNDTTAEKKDQQIKKSFDNNTVKIKIEVPVHKKVIIKKQIFIKDTNLHN
ncbi:MAG: hypothetical protein GXO80_11805 [Chlorobi bacterium]|nr:hypothetical protein [Chlorobiota bacterium]